MKTILGFTPSDALLGFNFFKMNLRDRYLGSAFGTFWAILNPIMMLAIYTFVFTFLFKSKLPGADTSLTYVIWLISGYGPWLATTEGLMAGTNSVTSSVGLVKNMAFKTEKLPIASAAVAIVSLTIALIFTLALTFADGNTPSIVILSLPLIVIVHFALIAALSTWLAAANVFFKDLALVLPNVLMVLMFLTPIFYPINTLPAVLQTVTKINPFYHISEAYRSVLLSNSLPNLWGTVYVGVLAIVCLVLALSAFRRSKGYFDSAL